MEGGEGEKLTKAAVVVEQKWNSSVILDFIWSKPREDYFRSFTAIYRTDFVWKIVCTEALFSLQIVLL